MLQGYTIAIITAHEPGQHIGRVLAPGPFQVLQNSDSRMFTLSLKPCKREITTNGIREKQL